MDAKQLEKCKAKKKELTKKIMHIWNKKSKNRTDAEKKELVKLDAEKKENNAKIKELMGQPKEKKAEQQKVEKPASASVEAPKPSAEAVAKMEEKYPAAGK